MFPYYSYGIIYLYYGFINNYYSNSDIDDGIINNTASGASICWLCWSNHTDRVSTHALAQSNAHLYVNMRWGVIQNGRKWDDTELYVNKIYCDR